MMWIKRVKSKYHHSKHWKIAIKLLLMLTVFRYWGFLLCLYLCYNFVVWNKFEINLRWKYHNIYSHIDIECSLCAIHINDLSKSIIAWFWSVHQIPRHFMTSMYLSIYFFAHIEGKSFANYSTIQSDIMCLCYRCFKSK